MTSGREHALPFSPLVGSCGSAYICASWLIFCVIKREVCRVRRLSVWYLIWRQRSIGAVSLAVILSGNAFSLLKSWTPACQCVNAGRSQFEPAVHVGEHSGSLAQSRTVLLQALPRLAPHP
jgi:hypothetical protein